jgi:hypothetical protein
MVYLIELPIDTMEMALKGQNDLSEDISVVREIVSINVFRIIEWVSIFSLKI